MKKLALLIYVLAASMGLKADGIEVTLYIDEAYKPFSYAEDGKPKGIYVDMLKLVFSKMPGFQVTLEPVPWKRGKKIMQEGEGFALAPAYFHGHDWPFLYPYSLPIFSETVIAICNESVMAHPRPNWPDDYKKLIIGNVAGYDGWGGIKFRKLVSKGMIYYQEVQNAETLIDMLLKGRLDCIMMENMIFDYHVRRLPSSLTRKEKEQIVYKKAATIGTDSVYIGYSAPAWQKGTYPFARDFQKAFDNAVYQLTQSGEIKNIFKAFKQE